MKNSKGKILVVDDDASIREAVVEILESEDFEVVVAADGLQALTILQNCQDSDRPKMILLDMMMPVLDGLGFLKEIKNNHLETFGKIPIVLASANGHLSGMENLPLPVEKIKKPFDLELLISVVEKFAK